MVALVVTVVVALELWKRILIMSVGNGCRDGSQPDVVYQLIGIVEHSGTMRGGHYVAYVKGCKMEGKDWSEGAISTWYYISDSHVREPCLESVLQSEAYLLFYERQTFGRQESD